MATPASLVTVTLQDENGNITNRSYEGKDTAITNAEAKALVDKLQELTQLAVVDATITVSTPVTGLVTTVAETNSSVSETASIRARKGTLGVDGNHSLRLPALKTAYKTGTNVDATNADIVAFLANFQNNDGGGTAGRFYVSDGEELSETKLPLAVGKVNK